jgi:uncharacterized protein YlzI (FlbEa/FlbD family)
MTSTPDTTITLTNLASEDHTVVTAWRYVDTTTPLDVTTTEANATSGNPNPPAITTVTNRAMIVAVMYGDDLVGTPTAPSGYALAAFRSATAGGVAQSYLLEPLAGTEDPGTYSFATNDDQWVCLTIGLRRSGAVPVSPTPSQTPSRTPSNTPSNTPTRTATTSVSLSPSRTPTITQTPSNTPTRTPTITQTPSNTPTRTPSTSAANTSNVCVSGAGTSQANGTYLYTGTLINGKLFYNWEYVPGLFSFQLYWQTLGGLNQWVMYDTNSALVYYQSTGTNTGTTYPWEAAGWTTSSGTAPAPTVVQGDCVSASPTPSPSRTATITPTRTVSITPSITPTRTPSITISPSNVITNIAWSNQEDDGTYWGGSYFLDCGLIIQKNSVEILRQEVDGTGNIGSWAAGDSVYAQAYAFADVYPPPATGTATITLTILNTTDSTTVFSDTISYTAGTPPNPTVVSATFTITSGKNYSISAFTTYTPVSATPSITPTRTPTITRTPTPTRTPSTSVSAGGITLVGTATSTVANLTLPTGLQQNDIVIVASYRDDSTTTLPTGYTAGQQGTSNSVNYRWAYKRMGATPDTTITGMSGTSVIHIAMVFRGVDSTTALDVTSPTVATNTVGMPNPPSITTVTNNSMIVALGYLDDDVIASAVTAPTNYTLARAEQYGSSGAGGTVMGAYRLTTTFGAQDPGVFGGGGDDSWVAATIALRPA